MLREGGGKRHVLLPCDLGGGGQITFLGEEKGNGLSQSASNREKKKGIWLLSRYQKLMGISFCRSIGKKRREKRQRGTQSNSNGGEKKRRA